MEEGEKGWVKYSGWGGAFFVSILMGMSDEVSSIAFEAVGILVPIASPEGVKAS